MPKLTKKQIEAAKNLYDEIRDNWPLRKGKNEFLKALSQGNTGVEDITRKEAIIAQCYHCCGGYEGGPYDCMSATCPLYSFMPYRDARTRMEEGAKAELIARLKAGKEAKEALRDPVLPGV